MSSVSLWSFLIDRDLTFLFLCIPLLFVNFTLVGADYFCPPINSFALCPGMQLFRNSLILSSLHLRFVVRNKSRLNPELITYHCKMLLFTPCPVNQEAVWSGRSQRPFVECWVLLSSIISGRILSWVLSSSFTCMSGLELSWICKRKPLQVSGPPPLGSNLFSGTLYWEFFLAESPQTFSFAPQFSDSLGSAWVSPPNAVSRKFSQGHKLKKL